MKKTKMEILVRFLYKNIHPIPKKQLERRQKSMIVYRLSIILSVFVYMVFGGMFADAEPLTISPPLRLDKTVLDRSIDLAGQYLLASQKDEGNFIYEYDFLARRPSEGDNQVRQAGALWGLVLYHKEQPSAQTLAALERGFGFFKRHSRLRGDTRYIVYPGEKKGSLGTVALVTLALLDFIPSIRDKKIKDQYPSDLKQYLNFLLSARQQDGRFHSGYDLETGKAFGEPSPYFDGETLLALMKAAQLPQYSRLKKMVLTSADAMYRAYVRDALTQEADSPVTKGFYQWGTMSFFEIYQVRWGNHREYGRRILELADWMMDVHHVLRRPKNTAYAYEGLSLACAVARLENHEQTAEKIARVIDEGMARLLSWQKGSPREVDFLKRVSDPRALGGVMNGEQDRVLRIDVAQHQLHAMILARKHLYFSLTGLPSNVHARNLSARDIEGAVVLAGEYLKNAVKENGLFVYEYFPHTNRQSTQYNMLRHAGTIYAMVEIYELTGDKMLLAAIQKTLSPLLDHIKSVRLGNHDVLVALDESQIKLGANALTILALTRYMKATHSRDYLDVARKLAKWMALTQSPQGRFGVHKQDFETLSVSDFESGYYPGEAIYALTALYRIDPQSEWLNTAEKAANYLIHVRDGGKTIVGLSHDHWLLYGLNALYRQRQNKMYYEHALKIAEAILSAQNKEEDHITAGSFDELARSTPAAARVEGLCAAYELARDFGTAQDREKIAGGIFRGIDFQIKNQVTKELMRKMKWSERAVGGFLESPHTAAIRIDGVQHNVSALLGAYRILREGR